jgi:hypothetical protein
VVSFIGVLRKTRQSGSATTPTEEFTLSFRPVLLLVGVVLLAALGLWRIDPIVNFSVLVLVLLLAEGVRDWRLLVGMPILTATTIYVLFILILNVYFPNALLA